MPQFNLAEAKARFSELGQKGMPGEEVIVAKRKKPVVKIVPIRPAKRKPDEILEADLEALAAQVR